MTRRAFFGALPAALVAPLVSRRPASPDPSAAYLIGARAAEFAAEFDTVRQIDATVSGLIRKGCHKIAEDVERHSYGPAVQSMEAAEERLLDAMRAGGRAAVRVGRFVYVDATRSIDGGGGDQPQAVQVFDADEFDA